ncbi:unnamed protein product [Oncorhynchus mykiss]|uniref:Uncharacterized protein n=1 Tax=Oncorhynchus mykiss TaxID=8022 RepID=A0A060Y397_ONCMY|nr:unnamed protein product [Oncorhynchus mykiss]
MACPFLEEPVDIAQKLSKNLPFLFFCTIDHSSEQCSHIVHMTHRGHALSSEQILCVALRFFAKMSFLYNIIDAGHISKATVCRAVRNVTLTLKHFSLSQTQQRKIPHNCRVSRCDWLHRWHSYSYSINQGEHLLQGLSASDKYLHGEDHI